MNNTKFDKDQAIIDLLDIIDLLEDKVSGSKIEFYTLAVSIQRNIIEIQRNEILKQAFVITHDNSSPTALEAIAMQLGKTTYN